MNSKYWVIVPAAGSSRRMGGAAAVPKQYLQLAGRAVIEWSLQPFLERDECERVVVVLAAADQLWPTLAVAQHQKIVVASGGAERVDSVRAGLQAVGSWAAERDWVVVHDAARPCLRTQDLDNLMMQLRDDDVGGLLAAPVVDTLKRADADGRVLETVPRMALWHALTPQLFRYGVLDRALAAAQQANFIPTDEAEAVQALGLRPRLVRGDADNIKITLPEDLSRAARVLTSRGAG